MDNNYKDKNKILSCEGCKFFKNPICYDCVEHNLFESKKDEKPVATVNGATINYKNWGNESNSKCETCKHKKVVSIDFPCCKCFTGEMWEADKSNANEENNADELNHPVRYARNGVECIDIMIKIFGPEAVKIFCKLNAFKYLWRSDFKGKAEDIKKAVVYLNRYLEIDEEENNK